jgi:hypothetical protein
MTVGSRSKFGRDFATVRDIYNYAQLHGSQEECFVIQKFGENDDIDASQTEDIWSMGGTRPIPGAAETFNITSTSDNDHSGQSGTNTLLIQGLDANYDLQEEIVTMDGQENVLTTNSYTNIHRMVSVVVGSGGSNVGVITATGSSSSNGLAQIPAGYNITQMSHYMIPRGYTGYILKSVISAYRADANGARQAEFSLWVKGLGEPELRTSIHGVRSNTVNIPYEGGVALSEKSLIWYESTAAATNTSVSAQYELLMVKKDWVRNP